MLKAEDSAPRTGDRHIGITPLDLRQPRFGTAMRGFDRGEVTAFLEAAAGDYEGALRENERLRQEIARLESALAQHRELEQSLKSTLVSAQKVGDDMRENARLDAARIVSEARGTAELLMQKAHAGVEDVLREIDGLKLKRREVQTHVEACISSLQSTLEFIREQEQRESRIVAHRPRVEIAG